MPASHFRGFWVLVSESAAGLAAAPAKNYAPRFFVMSDRFMSTFNVHLRGLTHG